MEPETENKVIQPTKESSSVVTQTLLMGTCFIM